MNTAALVTPRTVLGGASVVLIGVVVFGALPFAPPSFRGWLLVSGILAVIAAVQTAASDPRDLKTALLLALPVVIALVADGAPTWLIGPLGVLLLAAAELNALSWECREAERTSDVQRHRLRSVGGVAALALPASLAIAIVGPGLPDGGPVTLLLAAFVLAGLGFVLLRRPA